MGEPQTASTIPKVHEVPKLVIIFCFFSGGAWFSERGAWFSGGGAWLSGEVVLGFGEVVLDFPEVVLHYLHPHTNG